MSMLVVAVRVRVCRRREPAHRLSSLHRYVFRAHRRSGMSVAASRLEQSEWHYPDSARSRLLQGHRDIISVVTRPS